MRVSEITCRSIVNKTGGFLSGFTHTLNPYSGCSFGKTLCGMPDYAPEIIKTWGESRCWGEYLDVKTNAPAIYERDYDRIRGGKRRDLRIYMSSVTDPYVPQERRYRITRGILERMVERPPDLLALQTHTPNPLWDLDLLADLSRRFPLSVQTSVETDRESLGPLFRRHAYPVAERLEAMRRMTDRGLQTVGVVAPLWPVQDIEEFARRLDVSCRYVVVDHFLLGDGSRNGARTRRRRPVDDMTFPELLERAGFGEWATLEPMKGVVETFRRILGEERVGVSQQGFHDAAHRLL